jgi:O-antigen biosynthesis protein
VNFALISESEAIMEKVSIIIPAYLGTGDTWLGSYTVLCMHSLWLHAKEAEKILIDNGSLFPMRKHPALQDSIFAMQEYRKLKLERIDPPMVNFSKVCNYGAEKSSPESEFLVFLNNDTVVGPGWLETMIETYHQSPRTGVVGVWSNEIGGVQSIKLQAMNTTPYYTKLIKGVCMMVRREDFLRIGGFDEEYKKWYQDDDLSMKFYSSGYHNVIAPTFVMHFGSMTFKVLGIDLQNDLEIKEDVKRFKEKWADQFKGSMG